jgi:hypothetical protein
LRTKWKKKTDGKERSRWMLQTQKDREAMAAVVELSETRRMFFSASCLLFRLLRGNTKTEKRPERFQVGE